MVVDVEVGRCPLVDVGVPVGGSDRGVAIWMAVGVGGSGRLQAANRPPPAARPAALTSQQRNSLRRTWDNVVLSLTRARGTRSLLKIDV